MIFSNTETFELNNLVFCFQYKCILDYHSYLRFAEYLLSSKSG